MVTLYCEQKLLAMAKTLMKYQFVLKLFFLIEVSSYSVDKTCNNGSSLFKLEKAGSRVHEECCIGYGQKVSNESTVDTAWIKCVPICIPACKNGVCQSPGVCACETGYKPDPDHKNNCIPHCSDGCIHGTCVLPEQCYCDHGYEYDLDAEKCQPVCTEPCLNGICVSPENCQCYPGYRKSETNECQPYCSVGCDNGHCIGPDNCVCDPGWSHYNNHSVYYPGECFKIALTESSTESTPVMSTGGQITTLKISNKGETTTPIISNEGEITTSTISEGEIIEPETSTEGEIATSIDWSNDAITISTNISTSVTKDKQDSIRSDSDEKNNYKFYIIGSLLLAACLILLVVLIVKWTKLLDYLLGQSYTIQDKDVTDHNLEHLNS